MYFFLSPNRYSLAYLPSPSVSVCVFAPRGSSRGFLRLPGSLPRVYFTREQPRRGLLKINVYDNCDAKIHALYLEGLEAQNKRGA